MKAATLEQIPDIRKIDAQAIIEQALAADLAPENMFAETGAGGYIRMPDYVSGGEIVLPSLAVTTFRGNQARLVDLHTTNSTFEKFYKETAGTRNERNGMERRLTTMAFDGVVRILDTNGAQGLHHLHRSRFPNTVYYATSRGNGIRPHVYMTRVGDLALDGGRVPVLGMITATKDPAAELKFFGFMGKNKH